MLTPEEEERLPRWLRSFMADPPPEKAKLFRRRLGGVTVIALACLALGGIYAIDLNVAYDRAFTKDITITGQEVEGRKITVKGDMGGSVLERLSHRAIIERDKMAVEIRGICASACTIYLGYSDTCASASSAFMFHAPHKKAENQIRFIENFFLGNIIDATVAAYPEGLRDWAHYLFIATEPEQEFWLSGQSLINAGWVKECPKMTDPSADALEVFEDILARMKGNRPLPYPLPINPATTFAKAKL